MPLLGQVQARRLAGEHFAGGRGHAVADQQDDGRRREPCGRAGSACVRRQDGRSGTRSPIVGSAPWRPTGAGLDSLAAVQRDVADCRRCPRLVRWREEVARTGRASYAGQVYWGRGVPGFGDPQACARSWSAWRRPRTAPTAPGACSPGTARATGSSPPCTGPGSPRSPPARRATTAWSSRGAYITATVHCAPPANKPTPAERDACAPYLARELSLLTRGHGRAWPWASSPGRRSALTTGSARARPSATWPSARSPTAGRSSARTTRASRTPSPASSRCRCSTPSSPGPGP